MFEQRCACGSGERSLVLLSGNLIHDYPELIEFGIQADWRAFPDLGAVRVELGPGHSMSGVAELVQFLRGLLDEPRLNRLRAAWVIPHERLEEQLSKLIHAAPLLSLAPASSSLLLELLQARRLETWFQPVVSVATGDVWGFECLMRGRTTEGELVYPDQLIAWSKQENLTFFLDRLCRETHLRNAAEKLAGRDVQILINFLPTAIYQPEFCLATTMAAARKGGLDPKRVIFEVVETEKITDLEHLRSILDHYRAMGFRVALDDLGSGYSGLALLGDLNPDLIKIDRQLVTKAVTSLLHRSICESLTGLGKQHGKLVLAEGIETIEEKELMRSLGVDLFQGYLFGRPLPDPVI